MLRLVHDCHLSVVASEARARPTIPPVGVAIPLDRTLPDGFVLGRAPERRLRAVGGSGQRPKLGGSIVGRRNGSEPRPGKKARYSSPPVAGVATQARRDFAVLPGGDAA